MKFVIRYFFRAVRLILTPVVLLNEKLTTPAQAVKRSPEQQAEVDAACQDLALYQFHACPFCIRVRKEIARLGLNIEKRDAQKDEAHRLALLEGGGRAKVPCLRIEHGDGRTEWLYESDDIKAWLNRCFA